MNDMQQVSGIAAASGVVCIVILLTMPELGGQRMCLLPAALILTLLGIIFAVIGRVQNGGDHQW